ncbi:unnamed protein product [Soboliphyme baturini]|uniref:Exocyst complex component 5 n=1 Tax=Soboliphyme baturini TaxID=241478 RepID=A0A183J0R6_9BILA|nr:unnamed protein product [Soboliphyme baturini]
MLSTMIAQVKSVLSSEQKKADFKPEVENVSEIPLCSHACSMVCKYMNKQIDLIRDCLDGGNLEVVLTELSLRFHRAIVDNIYQFQYSSQGAMLLLCDIGEYRKVVTGLELPFVSKLFEALNALCNLLIVSPDNLASACCSGMLGDVERTVVVGFVQLRADYKTAKLNIDFQ